MNAVFGYRTKLQIAKKMVLVTATCTALYCEALPPPPPLAIGRPIVNSGKEVYFDKLQRALEVIAASRKAALDSALKARRDKLEKQKESEKQRERQERHAFHRYHRKHSTRLSYKMDIIFENEHHKTGESSSLSPRDDDPTTKGPSLQSSSSSSTSSSSSSSSSESSSTSDDDDNSSLESPSSSSSSSSSSDSSSESSDSDAEGGRSASVSVSSVSGAAPKKRLSSKVDSHRKQSVEALPDGSAPGRRASFSSQASSGGNRPTATSKQLPTSPSNIISTATKGVRKPKLRKRTIFSDDRPSYVIEIDEETDADICAVVNDFDCPSNMDMVNLMV